MDGEFSHVLLKMFKVVKKQDVTIHDTICKEKIDFFELPENKSVLIKHSYGNDDIKKEVSKPNEIVLKKKVKEQKLSTIGASAKIIKIDPNKKRKKSLKKK
jgi:hypothetical protein